MLTVALPTISKVQKQFKGPLSDDWICINIHLHIHCCEAYSIKKGDIVKCDSKNEPGKYYANQKQPDIKRKVLFAIIYVQNLKQKVK